MVFPFPTYTIFPLCQKSKDDLLPKNTLKDDIFGIADRKIHSINY